MYLSIAPNVLFLHSTITVVKPFSKTYTLMKLHRGSTNSSEASQRHNKGHRRRKDAFELRSINGSNLESSSRRRLPKPRFSKLVTVFRNRKNNKSNITYPSSWKIISKKRGIFYRDNKYIIKINSIVQDHIKLQKN